MEKKQNKYKIYIPSKKRADTCLTADILKNEGIDFKIVVEMDDYNSYSEKYGADKILVIDKQNEGISYVRNWIKNHSIENNEPFHWQIDDNIRSFRKRINGKNEQVTAIENIREAEEFVDRFSNIGIAGLTHTAFAFSQKTSVGINKQVYSCVLVRNDLPIFWRKNIVEDTDYSLQVLHLNYFRWCTLLFHKLLIEKTTTMKLKGGNTEIEYGGNGREKRSMGLIRQYPGQFKYTYQYGRIKILPSRIWNNFKQRPILK